MVSQPFFVRRGRGRGWVPFLVLVTMASVGMVAGTASAQDDPRKAESSPIFEEGVRLADEGKNAEALEKFQESYRLYPSPNALFNIARTEHLLGQKKEALRNYREAVKNPILVPRLKELARQHISELEQEFGRVEVTGPAGQFVVVNGVEYILPLKSPVDVDVGKVTVKGEGLEKTVEVLAGQVVTVDVSSSGEATVLGVEDAKPSPLMTTSPPREGEEGFWTTRRTLGVVSAGLAVAGGVVGTGFLMSREGYVKDAQDIHRADPTACGRSSNTCTMYENAKENAESAGTTALISYIAAGAFGVGAVILLWPSGDSKSSVGRVRVTPFGTGMSVSGSF